MVGNPCPFTMLGNHTIKLLTGSSHPDLARLIAQRLGVRIADVEGLRMPNSETVVLFQESVRDSDVYVLQTGHGSMNDLVIELLLMIDACRHASARRITAVIPLFPYARQDRKDKGRAPITARLIADMLEKAGCDHVVVLDLHAPQIEGFFNIPVDNLVAGPTVQHYLRNHVLQAAGPLAVIVSPDAGGAKRAASLADKLDLELALIHKERRRANEVSDMVLVGVVRGRICVLVDDMADTCGTLAKAAQTLMEHGALSVIALVTHGIFSGRAQETIDNSCLDLVVCTNSVPLQGSLQHCSKIHQIDISATLAEAIRRLHNGESISYLLRNEPLN